LVVAAAACFVVAFTRFDHADPPAVGSREAAEYEHRMMTQARWAVVAGLVGSFALLGGIASIQRARRGRTSS
jgi:hypothetical protein